MKGNYHTHTYRCHHATMEADEAYVKAAIAAHFDILAFTDHFPFDYTEYPCPFHDRMDLSEVEDYLSSIRSLKEKYADQIQILVGYEAEYYPEHMEHYKKLRKDVDLMIVGQHFKRCLDMDYADGVSDEDLDLLAEQLEGALASGLFCYLAHPDYFMMGRNHWNEACERFARRVAEMSLRYDIPIEVNLGGLKYGKRTIDKEEVYNYPYRPFWEVISQYPCKVIYGVDAHASANLTDEFRKQEVEELLRGLSLNLVNTIEIK